MLFKHDQSRQNLRVYGLRVCSTGVQAILGACEWERLVCTLLIAVITTVCKLSLIITNTIKVSLYLTYRCNHHISLLLQIIIK